MERLFRATYCAAIQVDGMYLKQIIPDASLPLLVVAYVRLCTKRNETSCSGSRNVGKAVSIRIE